MKYQLLATLFVVSALASGNANALEYVVKVKNKADFYRVVASIEKQMGVKVAAKDQHFSGGLAKISIGTTLTRAVVKQKFNLLSSVNGVDYIVPNIKFHALERSADPRTAEQWALEKVRAADAWNKTTGSQKIVVAVIDTGVDYDHEDLKANIWSNPKEIAGNKIDDDNNGYVDDDRGWDFYDSDNTPMDLTSAGGNPGHGTHCSGIVGAVGANGKGVSGINQQVSIMPIRFLGADGSGDLFNSIKAIDYAVANGARVISASWGAAITRSQAQPIIDAIERANQKNVLFVTAAGNDGSSNDTVAQYPANTGLDNVIDVAASDELDKKPYWSNHGKYTVDIASPGAGILSTLPNNRYGKLDGTSMAAPYVAGLAALLLSVDDTLNPRQLRSLMQVTGKQVDIVTASNRRIDAAAAVDAVLAKTLVVTPAAAHVEVGGSLQMGTLGGTGAFTFSVSDPDIATITESGKLTGVKAGDVKVTVKGSANQSATSLDILVGAPPKESTACPSKSPEVCQLLCLINPNNPWCDKDSQGTNE